METIEGNKLIMFFDGAEYTKIRILGKKTNAVKYKDTYYPDYNLPKFNEDWNLLMPVVEKIESLGYEVQIGKHLFRKDTHCCVIHDAGNALCIDIENDGTKINIIWQAVVEFILWYNTTLNK